MTRSSKEIIPGGRAKGMRPSDFDQKQLAKGIKVEKEHTGDADMAREIAMDHLAEIPDYYTRLEKMESGAGLKVSRINLPENQWVIGDPRRMDEDQEEDLWEIFYENYVQIGLPHNSIESLIQDTGFVWLNDVDGNGSLDSFIAYKKTPAGNKFQLMGARKSARRKMLTKAIDLLTKKGWFAEASHKVSQILEASGIMPIDDEQMVRDTLRKDIEWLGNGKYRRNITGVGPAVKSLYGNPKTRSSRKIAATDCSEYQKFHRQIVDLVREIEGDIQDLADDLDRSVESYLSDVEITYSYEHDVQCPVGIYKLPRLYQSLVNSLIECKEIPPRSQSRIQRIYKKANSIRKSKKPFLWYVRIRDDLQWVLTSNTWPDLSSSESQITVGNFVLTNQTDVDIKVPVKVLETAAKLVRSSGIQGLSKVLYGDVFVVSSISNKRGVMAWYNIPGDKVYLIAAKRFKHEQERSLLHELGHRFWRKFASGQKKDEWEIHHNLISGKKIDLKVGDMIPYHEYVIVGREPHGFRVVDSKGKSGVMTWKNVVEIQREAVFPTPYSRKNSEEHFCEALSLYLMGNLSMDHAIAFSKIWG